MQHPKYIEHGTEAERINAWQKILILLEEKKDKAKLMPVLQKHYRLNTTWDKVFSFWQNTSFPHWTDKMFEADKHFKIEVNKCNCFTQPQQEGNWATGRYYDINGMCKYCGLKLKK